MWQDPLLWFPQGEQRKRGNQASVSTLVADGLYPVVWHLPWGGHGGEGWEWSLAGLVCAGGEVSQPALGTAMPPGSAGPRSQSSE